MPTRSTIELKDLEIRTDIGTYGSGDVVPDAHSLDLSLTIDPSLVLIDLDSMDCVYDYDPLVSEIDRLAKDRHYETQEFLMTRIVEACATIPQIQEVSMTLRKMPVLGGSGSLGVRLYVDAARLDQMRKGTAAA
ncbi:MAG: dihydroneopterin aldolase [Pseudomonadota bacterium]